MEEVISLKNQLFIFNFVLLMLGKAQLAGFAFRRANVST